MKTSLPRYSASLLFCIFAAIRTGYGQTTDYASLTKAGRAESLAGHYQKAETLLRGALEGAQYSRDDYAVAAAQGDLGTVYQNEERLIEAERAYREALSIFSRIPDTNYEAAAVLRNLGSVYSVRGRDSDALKILYEASKLNRKDTPAGQALGAQILNGLGTAYFRQGNMGRAETLLAQAIKMQSLAGSDSDVTDAQILSNLGAIYQRQHKYGKAEESYKRSLEITEQRLGSAHPYLTMILANLADLYKKMRRYREAEDRYLRNLTILGQMTPSPDGRIVHTLQALSETYLLKGEKTGAESVLARALKIARRNPVPNLEMPMLLDAYADILKSLGNVQEAQRLNAEARRTRVAMALTVRVPTPK